MTNLPARLLSKALIAVREFARPGKGGLTIEELDEIWNQRRLESGERPSNCLCMKAYRHPPERNNSD